MIDYKNSSNKGLIYIIVFIDSSSNFSWCILIKNKNSQTITGESSNTLTKSKRKPFKVKNDVGGDFCTFTFQNFLKSKNIQHYPRFTDKEPSIAERVTRTILNLLKKACIRNKKR